MSNPATTYRRVEAELLAERQAMSTPYKQTRRERRADLDELDWRRAADNAWIEHKATAGYHTCSECFHEAFWRALVWYRRTQE